MDQSEPDWKNQLINIGVDQADVERAANGGAVDITSALDFIHNNSSSNNNNNNNQTVTSTDASHISFQNPTAFNTGVSHLSNARNSLDGLDIDVSRLPSDNHPKPDVIVNQNSSRPITLNVNNSVPNATNSNTQNKNNTNHTTDNININNSNHIPGQPKTIKQQEDDYNQALELSRKEQDDRALEQALHLSKQQSASTAFNNDHNDPDIIRAIEESLKENLHGTAAASGFAASGDRAVSWQSHAYHNSVDQLRENLDDPVGLRNIGNTCYLNSLLQVYFYLPDFRRAVLLFRPPPHLYNTNENTNNNSVVNFKNPIITGSTSAADTNAIVAQHRHQYHKSAISVPSTSVESATPKTIKITEDTNLASERRSESTSACIVTSRDADTSNVVVTTADTMKTNASANADDVTEINIKGDDEDIGDDIAMRDNSNNMNISIDNNGVVVQSLPVNNVTIDQSNNNINSNIENGKRRDTHVHTNTSNAQLTPAVGETSVSEKSDTRAERLLGESEQATKKHAVEFVVELQRLFAAMALGNQACVDPTAVARAMRDGDGNPIKIGDQQDASEFNHLFLDIVEKGLRADDDDGDGDKNDNNGNDAVNGPNNAVNNKPRDKKYIKKKDANKAGNGKLSSSSADVAGATTNATTITAAENIRTTGVSSNTSKRGGAWQNDQKKRPLKNVMKDLFTVKFQQEVQRCDSDEQQPRRLANSDGGCDTVDGCDAKPMVTNGETNCIIVDATTNKGRDLYSGLEDYAVARIEPNIEPNTEQKQQKQRDNKKKDSDTMKQNVSGGDATATVVSGGDKNLATVTAVKPMAGTSTSLHVNSSRKDNSGRTEEDAMDVVVVDNDDVEMQQQQQQQQSSSSNWALKSVWLTKLPPVLFIYLQRVRFIREKSMAEKVHDKYEFATEMALDRFLEKNREASMRARERVSAIRKERMRLNSLVRKYRSFPFGGSDNVATSHCSPNSPSNNSNKRNNHTNTNFEDGDVTMTPVPTSSSSILSSLPGTTGGMDMMGSSSSSAMSTLTPSSKVPRKSLDEEEGELFESGSRIRKRLLEVLDPSSKLFAVDGLKKERVNMAISTIERVLEHDRKQCERYERALSALPAEADMYQGLDKETYRLHAVLVHDGEPSGGHYWTFIRDWRVHSEDNNNWDALTWMRFSDSVATRVSQNEMVLWSKGGHGRASAYCLIYTRANNVNFGTGTTSPSSSLVNENIAQECRQLLPKSRLEEVEVARAQNKALFDNTNATAGASGPPVAPSTTKTANNNRNDENDDPKVTSVTIADDVVDTKQADQRAGAGMELRNQSW